MMHSLFKKRRNGEKSRTWYGRYKYDWMPVYKEINLGVTDKQVADKKLRYRKRSRAGTRRIHSAPISQGRLERADSGTLGSFSKG